MKKRFAILALSTLVVSFLGVASPAQAHCGFSTGACLPASAAGTVVFVNGAGIVNAGGETENWCESVNLGVNTCDSHEWNAVAAAAPVTCGAGTLLIGPFATNGAGMVTLTVPHAVAVVAGGVTGLPYTGGGSLTSAGAGVAVGCPAPTGAITFAAVDVSGG